MSKVWMKKPIEMMMRDSEQGGLKRTLGATSLVLLGIGAIIGAGLFVRTASASAEAAGPAVTISFMVAAIGCAFAGLCYAEFASMFPISGSAYAYAYTTMGELVAWIIGWALIMEYALGAATVSIAWSEYLNNLLKVLGSNPIPYEWCHSPFEKLYSIAEAHTYNSVIAYFQAIPADIVEGKAVAFPVPAVSEGLLYLSDKQFEKLPANMHGLVHTQSGVMNAPALSILLALTLLLIRGTKESAVVNGIIVFIKVAIVLVFIAVGFQFINGANYEPYTIPAGTPGHEGFFQHGWGGIFRGAAIVFFAFIGFDAVSTAAQEAKNPKRDMPIGILGSLVVCTILYILFAHVLTGVANWSDFADPTKGKEASVAYAIQEYMHGYGWLAKCITIAILAGFSSVILVMLMGQSRVFFSMSNDGLIPKVFSALHPKFRTPYKSNWILFLFVGLFAAFVPGSVAGDLTSFGTLLAFVLVCLGILVLRKTNPGIVRPFKTPWVPLVPLLGMLVCMFMIISLDHVTLGVALIWMVIGLAIYFGYSRYHSKIRNNKNADMSTMDRDEVRRVE
ncbi:MAG: amino acid permease [Flavobacteriales bacterium]